MRSGILFVAALALGAFGAHFLLDDSGYVLIDIRGYSVEMSVPGLVLGLILLYALIRLAVRLWRVPRRVGQAAGRYRDNRSRQQLTDGLLALAEGDAAKGERLLGRGAHRSDAPVVHYLTAARAAQQQGADERRDDWLKLALEQDSEDAVVVLLTQAELQLERQQLEAALATLQRLESRTPGNGRALALLAQVYRRLERWDDLESILPRLSKTSSLGPAELSSVRHEVTRALLARAAAEGDADGVEAIWKKQPKATQAQPEMVTAYARAVFRCGDHDRLEKTLRKSLKTSWNPALVEVYGELQTRDPHTPLAHAEAWLTRKGDDPVLLLAAARLCIRNQLWGKARSYLESSLAMQANAVGYRLYGQLLETMGEDDAAAEAFRLGLETATATALPALGAPTPADPA
jgi:HemY protein